MSSLVWLYLLGVAVYLALCLMSLRRRAVPPAPERNLRLTPIEEGELLHVPPEQWAADAAAAVERAEAPRVQPHRGDPDGWVELRSFDGTVVVRYPTWSE